MSQQVEKTFKHRGEDYPLTDDVALTAVGILNNYDPDIHRVRIRNSNSYVLHYYDDRKETEVSAHELVAFAHTAYSEKWVDAVDELELDPVKESNQ